MSKEKRGKTKNPAKGSGVPEPTTVDTGDPEDEHGVLATGIYRREKHWGGQEPVERNIEAARGKACLISDNGRVFPNRPDKKNEDNVGAVEKNGKLDLIVCDGAGGHEAGEVASGYTVEQLIERTKKHDFPLLNIYDIADEVVANKARFKNGLSTLAKVRIEDNRLEAFWAGDSPIIVIREGRVVYMSRPDSLVQLAYENFTAAEPVIKDGADIEAMFKGQTSLTLEQAQQHQAKNVILNSIGFSRPSVHHNSVDLQTGDVVIVASDGLASPLNLDALPATAHGSIKLDELNEQDGIKLILQAAEEAAGDPQLLAQKLIRLAYEGAAGQGRMDNVSAIAYVHEGGRTTGVAAAEVEMTDDDDTTIYTDVDELEPLPDPPSGPPIPPAPASIPFPFSSPSSPPEPLPPPIERTPEEILAAELASARREERPELMRANFERLVERNEPVPGKLYRDAEGRSYRVEAVVGDERRGFVRFYDFSRNEQTVMRRDNFVTWLGNKEVVTGAEFGTANIGTRSEAQLTARIAGDIKPQCRSVEHYDYFIEQALAQIAREYHELSSALQTGGIAPDDLERRNQSIHQQKKKVQLIREAKAQAVAAGELQTGEYYRAPTTFEHEVAGNAAPRDGSEVYNLRTAEREINQEVGGYLDYLNYGPDDVAPRGNYEYVLERLQQFIELAENQLGISRTLVNEATHSAVRYYHEEIMRYYELRLRMMQRLHQEVQTQFTANEEVIQRKEELDHHHAEERRALEQEIARREPEKIIRVFEQHRQLDAQLQDLRAAVTEKYKQVLLPMRDQVLKLSRGPERKAALAQCDALALEYKGKDSRIKRWRVVGLEVQLAAYQRVFSKLTGNISRLDHRYIDPAIESNISNFEDYSASELREHNQVIDRIEQGLGAWDEDGLGNLAVRLVAWRAAVDKLKKSLETPAEPTPDGDKETK